MVLSASVGRCLALILCCAILVAARLRPVDLARAAGSVPSDAHVPYDGSEQARSRGLHFNPRQHVLDVIGDKHELVHPQRVRGTARHQLSVNRKGTVLHPDRYEFKLNGQCALSPLFPHTMRCMYHR